MGTTKFDDYDSSVTGDTVKTVTFAVDGERWTIDLGPESKKALFTALKPFTEKATKGTTAATPPAAPSTRVRQNDGWNAEDVRAFWKNADPALKLPTYNESGAIYKKVYEAFNADHPAK